MEVTIGTIHPTIGIIEAPTEMIETQHIMEDIKEDGETVRTILYQENRMMEREGSKPLTGTRHIMEDIIENVGTTAKIELYLRTIP